MSQQQIIKELQHRGYRRTPRVYAPAVLTRTLASGTELTFRVYPDATVKVFEQKPGGKVRQIAKRFTR